MIRSRFRVPILFLFLACPIAPAQGLAGLEPFSRTGDLVVTDRSAAAENVRRLMDLNLDGDFDDPGEVVVVYSGLTGQYALSNESGLAVGPDGTIYVCDSTTDVILALLDLNGDGDAMDAGEAQLFFDGNPGGNASGVVMSSAQDLTVDAAGTVWVANAATTAGNDAILRLADAGGTFGANDAGEASEYATFPGGPSLPSDIVIGPGGFVYFLETGTSTTQTMGIWRLHDDVVPNGNCNDPGEVSPFYTPPLGSASLFSLGIDSAGFMYVSDTLADTIMLVRDLNSDLTIALGGPEEALFWQSSGSILWNVSVASDSDVFVSESTAPERVLRLTDTVVPNGNALDPGETVTVYSSTVSPTALGDIFSLTHLRAPALRIAGVPSVSSPFGILLQATVGDGLSVWASTGTIGASPVPPYGNLSLSLAPPDVYFEVFNGIVSSNGGYLWGLPALNAPQIVGITVHLQGIAGTLFRAQFTNLLDLTFQP